LEASVKQRSQEMVLDTGRGNFLYENGMPITHKSIPVLILFPFLENMEWDRKKVAEIIGVKETALQKALRNAKEPIAFGEPKPLELTENQMKKINALQIPGVFAAEKKFDLLQNPAEHLIG